MTIFDFHSGDEVVEKDNPMGIIMTVCGRDSVKGIVRCMDPSSNYTYEIRPERLERI